MPDEQAGGEPTQSPTPAAPVLPDPIQLSAQLVAAQDVAHRREVELAVARQAAAQGLDPEPLLDSRSFLDRATSLDHRADDFTTRVGELVKAAALTRHGSNSMPEPTTPDMGNGTATATAAQPANAEQPRQQSDTDGTDWKAEAEKWKALARKHEDQNKATREENEATRGQLDQQQKLLKLIAEKTGVAIDDGQPPDPNKLAAELDRARSDARQRAVELAVYRSAGKANADADALLDSRAFQSQVADLDPTAADFADKVNEAITKVVESNPRYKLPEPAKPAEPPKPTVPKSGSGEFSGTPGGNRQWTEDDVRRASPTEVAKAMEEGLLIDLGFAPPKKRR